MSARVFNPLFMSEMLRGGGNPGGASAPFCGAEISSVDPSPTVSRPVGVESVRRQLFGPVDHEENRRFVKRELQQQRSRLSEKYNFDFARERPLKGKLAWEKVTDSVPEPYALRRLPFLTHHAEAPAAPDSHQEDAPAPAESSQEATPPANNNNHVSKQKRMTGKRLIYLDYS